MRTLAFLLGLAAFAGLVVLAVAGFPGARALLATGLGIVAIIALGVQMGGRHSSTNRPRFEGDATDPTDDPVADPDPDPGDGGPGATGR